MSPDKSTIERIIWEMPIAECCALMATRIIKTNRDIVRSNLGLMVMIETLAAYLSDEQCGPHSEQIRDLADRIEQRVLRPVKVV